MTEKCKNCGNLWYPQLNNKNHPVCPAVDRGDLTVNGLWSKVETGGKPHQCTEWKPKDEDEN